jgi:hypothetical protein
MCKVRAILPALAALGALAGCAEEGTTAAPGPGWYAAMTAAELRTIGRPGAPDLPFGEALVTYSEGVRAIHAFEGPRADRRTRWAVRQLAVVLERMPAASAEPRLRRAAGEVRTIEASAPEDAPAVEETRHALAIAATALLDLAVAEYGDDPAIATRARAFAETVKAIDPQRTPPDRAGAINALLAAEQALASMYAANIAPPRS